METVAIFYVAIILCFIGHELSKINKTLKDKL